MWHTLMFDCGKLIFNEVYIWTYSIGLPSLRLNSPLIGQTSILANSTDFGGNLPIFKATYRLVGRTPFTYRSAPQVANLGGHPVQPPFKIPESIIY